MFKKYILLLFLFFSFHIGFSQYKKLTPKAEVSIITAGPGKILYEGFGHSTIRIKDVDFDLAYNYGIFDFDAPNFYLNFTKGKLLYKLLKYPFHYFVRSYHKDKRWVKEQVLNLTQEEKQHFFEYLENNAKPENASYYYDPYFNNCATKLREITDIVLKNKVVFNTNHLEKKQSFRELMNREIPWNTWGSFGINLALGSKLDVYATPKEHMYLPDYVYYGFKNATVEKKSLQSLIKKEHTILSFEELKINTALISPFTFFTIFLLIGIYITYRDIKSHKRSKWLDFGLLFTTGILGLLITFLWFFTDHSTTPNNFNCLWAFAPNTIIAFYMLKKEVKKWIKTYLKILLMFLSIIPIIWTFKIQQFPFANIPLLLLLAFRYFSLLRFLLPLHK